MIISNIVELSYPDAVGSQLPARRNSSSRSSRSIVIMGGSTQNEVAVLVSRINTNVLSNVACSGKKAFGPRAMGLYLEGHPRQPP